MGFFSWLFTDEQTREKPKEETTPPVSDILLKAIMNHQIITRKEALTLPAVNGAVDLISNMIASMPIRLYKTNGKDIEEIKDKRTILLNGDTGDTLDAFQMKKAMVEDYLLGQGGFCYIEKVRNDVVSLRYVEDTYITILKNFRPIFKSYDILVEGKAYKDFQFIKILRNTRDGSTGHGITEELSTALRTAYETLIYQLGLVKSGGSKKGFIKSSRKLGQEEIDLLKTAWHNMYSNSNDNAVVLNNGLDFQEASTSSVEMQLDQNKRTLAEEINNIFHITPNNFWQTYKEAIYPIVRAFQTALNKNLLLEVEKETHYFEFDTKEIIKANLQERYSAYKQAKETGFMTINEIRAEENREHIEGLDVVNVGLGAVLYDINTHKYYTPNTDTLASTNNTDKMLIGHELQQAYDASGNSAEK